MNVAEWKLFDGDVAHVSTEAFHEHRERAPHWEQAVHRDRLEAAHTFVVMAAHELFADGRTHPTIVDLGCGDGGLVAALRDGKFNVYGYDFQPSNFMGHVERGVAYCCFIMDFVAGWDEVVDADVYVMTEVLEHLTDPHSMLRRVRERNAILIASSPYTEHAGSHDECHAWAWDQPGYREMIESAGFHVVDHVTAGGMFQVVRAVSA